MELDSPRVLELLEAGRSHSIGDFHGKISGLRQVLSSIRVDW